MYSEGATSKIWEATLKALEIVTSPEYNQINMKVIHIMKEYFENIYLSGYR